jgi:hypothetical protein
LGGRSGGIGAGSCVTGEVAPLLPLAPPGGSFALLLLDQPAEELEPEDEEVESLFTRWGRYFDIYARRALSEPLYSSLFSISGDEEVDEPDSFESDLSTCFIISSGRPVVADDMEVFGELLLAPCVIG